MSISSAQSNPSKQLRVSRELKPGRVAIITFNEHYNKLAIVLLASIQSNRQPSYKVLVLDDQPNAEIPGQVNL